MTDSVEFSYLLILIRGYIMNIHFEYCPDEKAPLGELVEMCDVALALIHERAQLFKLLRTYSACEERNNIFNATLKRLKDLERISQQVESAFCNPVVVRDGRGGVEAVPEEKPRAIVLQRSARGTPAKCRSDHARG
jgi:hypothetical protein